MRLSFSAGEKCGARYPIRYLISFTVTGGGQSGTCPNAGAGPNRSQPYFSIY